MKIIFHKRYFNSDYAMDPAAGSGRLDGVMEIINQNVDFYDVIEPKPAEDADILLAHGKAHLEEIKREPLLYELSALAAGGSIMAAEEAFAEKPSFAVIRPPGHHASAGSCWGFCYFNNISISLLKLFSEKKIRSAFVLDFDLHAGDGNLNILEERQDDLIVSILNPMSNERVEYIEEVENYMQELQDVDIFVASAGFDHGIDDWGHLLYPEDYTELGRLMKEYSEKLCSGRRYALLEGGYNHDVLGLNVDAFCRGFE